MDGRLCLESVQCGKGYVEISESYIFFSCALHIFRLWYNRDIQTGSCELRIRGVENENNNYIY